MTSAGGEPEAARAQRAIRVTLPPSRGADPPPMRRSAPLLLLVSVLVLASGGAADPLAPPALGLHDRLDLGLRAVDVALDVASPGAASNAVSGEGRVETELALGARLAFVQPYTVALDGTRLGASRIEARRALELGAQTLASLDLSAERGVAGAAARARTRVAHRFTPLAQAELSVDLGAASGGARSLAGGVRFERRF